MTNRLILFALMCVATIAQAQNNKGTFSIKPMAGVNVSTFSGGIVSDLYHTKAGFTAGMEAEYGINNWFGLSLGLIYSQQGAKIDGDLGVVFTDASTGKLGYMVTHNEGKINCDYLNLPMMANFYIPAIPGLSLKTGIQMGILVNDKMKMTTDAAIFYDYVFEQTEINYEPYAWNLQDNSNPSTLFTLQEYSTTDICKSIDFGIPIGLSYEYKSVTLDARYYFGLTKLDKTENPENTRNRCLSITLGYRFHL